MRKQQSDLSDFKELNNDMYTTFKRMLQSDETVAESGLVFVSPDANEVCQGICHSVLFSKLMQ